MTTGAPSSPSKPLHERRPRGLAPLDVTAARRDARGGAPSPPHGSAVVQLAREESHAVSDAAARQPRPRAVAPPLRPPAQQEFGAEARAEPAGAGAPPAAGRGPGRPPQALLVPFAAGVAAILLVVLAVGSWLLGLWGSGPGTPPPQHILEGLLASRPDGWGARPRDDAPVDYTLKVVVGIVLFAYGALGVIFLLAVRSPPARTLYPAYVAPAGGPLFPPQPDYRRKMSRIASEPTLSCWGEEEPSQHLAYD